MSDELTGDLPTDMSKYDVELTQKQQGWQNEFNFPENLAPGSTVVDENGTCTFTWNSTDNKLEAFIKLTKKFDLS